MTPHVGIGFGVPPQNPFPPHWPFPMQPPHGVAVAPQPGTAQMGQSVAFVAAPAGVVHTSTNSGVPTGMATPGMPTQPPAETTAQPSTENRHGAGVEASSCPTVPASNPSVGGGPSPTSSPVALGPRPSPSMLPTSPAAGLQAAREAGSDMPQAN
eukprot:4780367-Amphidinium_carterae.1